MKSAIIYTLAGAGYMLLFIIGIYSIFRDSNSKRLDRHAFDRLKERAKTRMDNTVTSIHNNLLHFKKPAEKIVVKEVIIVDEGSQAA